MFSYLFGIYMAFALVLPPVFMSIGMYSKSPFEVLISGPALAIIPTVAIWSLFQWIPGFVPSLDKAVRKKGAWKVIRYGIKDIQIPVFSAIAIALASMMFQARNFPMIFLAISAGVIVAFMAILMVCLVRRFHKIRSAYADHEDQGESMESGLD